MIDFAGLVGRFTGKGAPDGAQAGASTAAGTDGGIATGGQFAALVSLAAQLGADQDQTKLRLVVDNGAVAGGAAMDATATPVTLIDPAMSGRIAAWTGVTRDRMTAPQEIDPGAEGEGSLSLAEAQASDDSDSAKEASASEDGAPATAPVTANPTPLVALPVTQAQAASDAVPATETTRIGTKGQPESIVPSRRDAAQSGRKAAGKSVADGADRPGAGATGEPRLKIGDQPLPKAIQAFSALPKPGTDAAPGPQGAAEPAAPLVVATAQQAMTAATGHDATSAPAITDKPSEAMPDGAGLSAREQSVPPIAVAPAPAPVRSRTAPRSAAADDAVSPSVETAAGAQGEESMRPVASATTKTSDRSFAVTSDAGPANAPLRAIVEALPPVLQSELSTSAVHGTTGPSTGEALGDQVIDMGVSGQWIDRMAREIAGLADGTGHSRFTLNPPHLGRLQVDLWREQGATNVRLMTETDEAAQRLSDGRQALQSDARVAALSLGTITVEKSSGSFDTNRDQPRQGGESAGQAQQQAGGGQAQGRAGNGGQGSQGQTSDWVRRIARDDANQPSDASARAPAERAANGRVRFA